MSARSRRLPSRTVPNATVGSRKLWAVMSSVTHRDRMSPFEARLVLFILVFLSLWALSAVATAGEENIMALRGNGNMEINRFTPSPEGMPGPTTAYRVARIVPSTSGMVQPLGWKNGCVPAHMMVAGKRVEMSRSRSFDLTPRFVETSDPETSRTFIQLLLEEISR